MGLLGVIRSVEREACSTYVLADLCVKDNIESLGMSHSDVRIRNNWRSIKGAVG